MQKSASAGINVWFWSRGDASVPAAVRGGGDWVAPDATWGSPGAAFGNVTCDYESHFNAHSIIFDLTLCVSILPAYYGGLVPERFFQGDFAGSVFPTSGCGAIACTDCKPHLVYITLYE